MTHKHAKMMTLLPVPTDIFTEELEQKAYIYGFSSRAKVKVIRATGETLQMPEPVHLDKAMSVENIFRENFLQLRNLSDEGLIVMAKKIFPSKENLLSCIVHAIVESEEDKAGVIPAKIGTWVLGFCVDSDEVLCALSCDRHYGGWSVLCDPVRLDSELVPMELYKLKKVSV